MYCDYRLSPPTVRWYWTVAGRKEFAMIESWMGVVVGSFALAIAAMLVMGHYRREHLRERLLRRMDHRHCWDVMRRRR
jgi:hypothetical protein